MFENSDSNSSPSQNDEYGNSSADYLRRAAQACAAGDAVLGLHLYLAAFEKGAHAEQTSSSDTIEGLRQAWSLACKLKERSLAEYIFEKLEPFLSAQDIAIYADQLQKLALDKLEEFGLSREDLEDMTDMISQDFLGVDVARLMKVEHITLPQSSMSAKKKEAASTPIETAVEKPTEVDTAISSLPLASTSEQLPQGLSEGEDSRKLSLAAQDEGASILASSIQKVEAIVGDDADAHAIVSTMERISYADIVGYDEAVSLMRDFGLGMQDDAQFQDLVTLLNTRHGLDRMPASDAILFRSPAREDANRFMTATLGELNLPAIRMRMEENLQGMPVLCVMAQADNQPKLNSARNAFEGAGVLVLEDLDLWMSPLSEPMDDLGGFMFASLSRGAREAINLIRSAAENPDVFVLATTAETGDVEPFFFDLLEPLSIIEIDYPTESERADVWKEIVRDHPSLGDVDQAELVKYSTGMPRYDIYMAAREAIEDTYKASLMARNYSPVTKDNLFEKLAAYQPLESEEYQALEDAVINDFRRELEQLDELLKGTEG